jgi:hypothetical protein
MKINKTLSTKPEKHTVIFILEMFRCAKPLVKKHLGVCYERYTNYIDDSVLTLLSKRNATVKATIYTKQISNQLNIDIQKHNAQYPPIELKLFLKSHDRFLIIDHHTVYHIGASLKDLGKKWFAFSKMELSAEDILNKLES